MRTAQCAFRSLVGAARCPRASPRHNSQLLLLAIDPKCAKEGELPDSFVETNDGNSWSPYDISARALELPDELRPVLGEFRALLAGSWSPATAYPGSVTSSHWSAGSPRGQCGVSSAWLAEVLHRKYSIGSTFCRGSLIFGEHVAKDLLDHCWLEITAESGEELVLDLTCDQAQDLRDRSSSIHGPTSIKCAFTTSRMNVWLSLICPAIPSGRGIRSFSATWLLRRWLPIGPHPELLWTPLRRRSRSRSGD